MSPAVQITCITKVGGPLTKRIYLTADGSLKSDGSACLMGRGQACRAQFSDLRGFADCIANLAQHEAVALGSLRPDLPSEVEITTKDKLGELNGAARPDLIARTGSHIVYCTGQSALALLDFDTKGIPPDVAARIGELGDYWAALVSVVPELGSAARVTRRSTSAGIYRADTDEKLPGSDGLHVFVHVKDGTDIERFLKTLHARCWLAGFGWSMVGAGGQLLERSIVDRMVGAPERLVFEGAPVLEPPLAQDQESRRPIVTDGDVLDTVAACPPLSIVEQAKLRELCAKEAVRLAPEVKKAKAEFITRQCHRLVERTGMDQRRARRVVERQCSGILLPDLVLPFDDPELTGSTVADVLGDPDRFEGPTLADPLEGVEYGICKARIMRRPDGHPWVHSYAHGRTVYQLKYDARAAGDALQRAPRSEAADLFVRLVLAGDLDAAEIEDLRDIASKHAEVGKRALDAKLKAARKTAAAAAAQFATKRRLAERRDPRPQIEVPLPDAPWLPVMGALNEVLGRMGDAEPPVRDVDGIYVKVRVRRALNMHRFTSRGANAEETVKTRLPPPEQPLLTRLSEAQLAEEIERYIDHVDATGRAVHLGGPFVHHFHTRPGDNDLPLAAAIATLPIMLGDGTLLGDRGLDRDRGIIFRVPNELLAIIPRPEACTPSAIAAAMRFLTDEWLVDVASDYAGKCILIAAALTVIERSVLANRPTFWVTAGRRGGGKTTVIIMLLMAVTGVWPAAAAWSPNEEERRKALLAYLLEAMPAIVWDNIPRGTQISCPHIEKSCTTAFYSDRRLGVSETVAVSAAVIHFFTGNNVGTRKSALTMGA